jgi:hypothetical protein
MGKASLRKQLQCEQREALQRLLARVESDAAARGVPWVRGSARTP